jgi:uncharacterized Zn finger protein
MPDKCNVCNHNAHPGARCPSCGHEWRSPTPAPSPTPTPALITRIDKMERNINASAEHLDRMSVQLSRRILKLEGHRCVRKQIVVQSAPTSEEVEKNLDPEREDLEREDLKELKRERKDVNHFSTSGHNNYRYKYISYFPYHI